MEKYATVKGGSIRFRVFGKGDPLLLIRGYGSHSDWWAPGLIENLSKCFAVITYDHRGTGKSIHDYGDYTIDLLAEDAVSVIRSAGFDKAHIFGLSMGGMVAQVIAVKHKNHAASLILGATHCGGEKAVMPDENVMKILLSRASEDSDEGVGHEWLNVVFTPEFVVDSQDEIEAYLKRSLILPTDIEIVRKQADAVAAFDMYDSLINIDFHIWILHGGRDRIVPVENAHILNSRIPDSALIVMRDLGHDYAAQDPVYTARLIGDLANSKQQ